MDANPELVRLVKAHPDFTFHSGLMGRPVAEHFVTGGSYIDLKNLMFSLFCSLKDGCIVYNHAYPN